MSTAQHHAHARLTAELAVYRRALELIAETGDAHAQAVAVRALREGAR